MRADRVVRGLIRSSFVVTMKSSQTWEGVLVEVDPSTLALRSASEVHPDGVRVAADGTVYLPRSDVAYMQHV